MEFIFTKIRKDFSEVLFWGPVLFSIYDGDVEEEIESMLIVSTLEDGLDKWKNRQR